MRIRIVVADQAEVDFYDVQHADEHPRFVGGIGDPAARLHDRDLKSDRPGRVFDHAARAGGRRGSTSRHGTGGERSPRKHEAAEFARQVAEQLQGAYHDAAFERLVLIAPPTFMGLLRQALPQSLASVVVAEVSKDLVHASPEELRSHLPRETFARPLPSA